MDVTGNKKKIRIKYIGNVLPMEIVEEHNLSIAGKKYELSLLKHLNMRLNNELEILSVCKEDYNYKNKEEVFDGKKYKLIRTINIIIINDIIRCAKVFFDILLWAIKNIRAKKVIIILNSPFGICLVSLITKMLFNIRLVSLTIDNPFIEGNIFRGIYGKYEKISFKVGHYLIKYFNGIIVLNKNAIKYLNLDIPYLLTKVGFDKEKYNKYKHKKDVYKSNKKSIIYGGTFHQCNNINGLLDAFTLLNKEKYELNIYGYGPLEQLVKEYSLKNENIKYHGRINNNDYIKILSKADLLINPRVTSTEIRDFGFPSKVIEYLLAERPLLSTKFNGISERINSLIFCIEENNAEGIRDAIMNVLNKPNNEIEMKVNNAKEYVCKEHDWDNIVEEIMLFIQYKIFKKTII